MTKYHVDTLLQPTEYYIGKDKVFINPPLIDTSLSELAHHGWLLHIVSTWYPNAYARTKTRFRFYDPKDGNRAMLFKYWHSTPLASAADALEWMHVQTFIPTASNLRPAHDWLAEDDELGLMTRVNTLREIRQRASRKPTPPANSNFTDGPMFDPVTHELMPRYVNLQL